MVPYLETCQGQNVTTENIPKSHVQHVTIFSYFSRESIPYRDLTNCALSYMHTSRLEIKCECQLSHVRKHTCWTGKMGSLCWRRQRRHWKWTKTNASCAWALHQQASTLHDASKVYITWCIKHFYISTSYVFKYLVCILHTPWYITKSTQYPKASIVQTL